MTTYQIRYRGAPLGRDEYEIVSTHLTAVEVDIEWERRYAGRPSALDHEVWIVRDGHAELLADSY